MPLIHQHRIHRLTQINWPSLLLWRASPSCCKHGDIETKYGYRYPIPGVSRSRRTYYSCTLNSKIPTNGAGGMSARQFSQPGFQHSRSMVTSILSELHPVIVAPLVFLGLVGTLWAYKFFMMVLFQNKIIYMPGVPLGARRETIDDYAGMCSGIKWTEVKFPTEDGVMLGGAITDFVVAKHQKGERCKSASAAERKRVIIIYLQGNASSTPPRLPMLSSLLKGLQPGEEEVVYTIFAPSYRGYWTSTGRPSQRGIEIDGRAIFDFVQKYISAQAKHTSPPNPAEELPLQNKDEEKPSVTKPPQEEDPQVILWGQSIGANISLTILANHLCSAPANPGQDQEKPTLPPPAAVILETPFLSIPHMLIELYPQKWLPYRYLTPFLRNWWDLEEAVRRLHGAGYMPKRGVLVLQGERDELVGAEQGEGVVRVVRRYLGGGGDREREVEKNGDGDGDGVRTVVVRGALHVECVMREQGRSEVLRVIREVGRGSGGYGS